ncbi:metal-dependent hydrolase [Reyranella sp. CPCC 100927]|uniref:metal-dependent hydrolase n=1 Tax=Reyranella sp. CPCC 100927 TaxID=2599616 RepID=UPI0011B5807C|nr:metal-dependent hydrolase [Reyranella sp. CPCC 100927]TWT13704.1 metal-dependent hydrolase [Reyranella sp. CPCC 100927]
MHVRCPRIDFSNLNPRWSWHHEFAQRANANSVIPAYIEPFIVKVMHQAKAKLGADDRQLRDDIDIFIKQEVQHYKLHNAFNARIRAAGYPGIAAFEDALQARLQRIFDTKSLAFKLAYAVGFESSALVFAHVWFTRYAEYLDGADPDAVRLWKWHWAEEYEHRDVAFRVYKTIVGRRGLFGGYFYRVSAFLAVSLDLMKCANAIASHLLAVDRATMTPEHRQASEARDKAFMAQFRRDAGQALLNVLRPSYDPATATPTPQAAAYLASNEMTDAP